MKPTTSTGSRRRVSAEDALALWREYQDAPTPALRDRIILTLAPMVTLTVHPSSILRAPDSAARQLARDQFVADLKTIVGRLPSGVRRRR